MNSADHRLMSSKFRITIFSIFAFASFLALAPPAFAHVKTVETVHTNVNVRSGPGTGNRVIAKAPTSQNLRVMQSKKSSTGKLWYQIEIPGSQGNGLGWVSAEFFRTISPDQVRPPRRRETEAGVACLECQNISAGSSNSQRNLQSLNAVAETGGTGYVWPVEGRLNSRFGNRRHPIKGVTIAHKGIDISGNSGRQVRAVKAGVVEVSAGGCRNNRMSCNGGAGNMVSIRHRDGTVTRYMHLNSRCNLPRAGVRLSQGNIIGCVGSTGSTTGPNLHFEVIRNGEWINPLSILSERS